MTTFQAQVIGDHALMARGDLERLLEIARRSEPIQLQLNDDLPTADVMRMADTGGAFQFWQEAGEDIYSADDGEPVR
jgi:hypothetical protein